MQTTTNSFKKSNLDNLILKAIKELDFFEQTPVQKIIIPYLLDSHSDLIVSAQTGTGKTAAFALPQLERLKKESTNPQVLVLTPTRELAMQVADSFRAYAAGHPELKILAVYGGADFRSQVNSLRRGIEAPSFVIISGREGKEIWLTLPF